MCEKCLSRTNCQFLGTHKNVSVEGCTAFRDEEEYVAKIKAEAIKEVYAKVEEKFPEGLYNSNDVLTLVEEIVEEMGVEL